MPTKRARAFAAHTKALRGEGERILLSTDVVTPFPLVFNQPMP
jgi:hypothetical protein